MNKRQQILIKPEALLDEIGGEELAGLGFEKEIPESDFVGPDSPTEGEER